MTTRKVSRAAARDQAIAHIAKSLCTWNEEGMAVEDALISEMSLCPRRARFLVRDVDDPSVRMHVCDLHLPLAADIFWPTFEPITRSLKAADVREYVDLF